MNYLKHLAVLAAFLLLISSVGRAVNIGNSLLWEVSGNGLGKPSYLFGTHHLVPISFLDSVAGVKDAFENKEQTVGEIDMTKMAELQIEIMSESTMPADFTYDKLLPTEDIALLDNTLSILVGVGLEQLGTLKPAILSNLITLTLYQKYYPSLSTEKSLDQFFQEEALKRNREIVGL